MPDQVEAWVSQWNYTNQAHFNSKNLKPLSTHAVLAQPELAAQPLLLLMLALYDADSNALQEAEKDLSHAQLYERLLSQFAGREVRKERPDLDEQGIAREVEAQLLRLSIAAFAMFNRGRQWSTQAELDVDLAALLPETDYRSAPKSFRAPLTTAQLVMGKFFFVHQAQAVQDGTRLSSFEFLHATFGEYLVARIVSNELRDLVAFAALAGDRSRRNIPNDDYLRALLSFSPLSARTTTVDYLSELLSQMPAQSRQALDRLMRELFCVTFVKYSAPQYSTYEPVDQDVMGRMACYSANLLLLIVIVSKEVNATSLFPDSDDVVASWRRAAMLWRAALPEQGWLWLANSFTLNRILIDGQRDINVSLSSDGSTRPIDLFWSYALEPKPGEVRNIRGTDYRQLLVESSFMAEPTQDAMTHALEPFYPKLANTITTVSGTVDRNVSVAHALIRLWIASTTEARGNELASAYEVCIDVALHGFEGLDDTDAEAAYRAIIVHLLSGDSGRVPGQWSEEMRQKLRKKGAARTESARAFCDRIIMKLGFRLS